MSWLGILDAGDVAPTPKAVGAAVLIVRILFGAALGLISIGLLRFMLRAWKLDASPPNAAQPTWNLKHIGGLVALYVALDLVVSIVFRPEPDDLMQGLALSVVISIVVVAVAILIASKHGRAGRAAFGLIARGSVRPMLLGVCGYVMFIPGFIGSGLVWDSLLQLLGHHVKPQHVLTGFTELEAGRRWIPVVIGVLVIPFFEEALFRGFLQPVLVQWLRPWPGIAATAAFFGLVHGLDAFFPIFALAMLMGWMRHATERLSASYAIHALHNGLTIYVALHFPEIVGVGGQPGYFHLTP